MAFNFDDFSIGSSVVIDYDEAGKTFALLHRDAKKATAELTAVEKQANKTAAALRKINSVNAAGTQKATYGTSPANTTTTRATGLSDPALARAQADIARMQAARRKLESDYTTHVVRQSEQQYKARVNSYQKSLREFQRVNAEQKRTESSTGTADGNNLLFGGAVIGAVIALTAALKEGGQAVFDYTKKLEGTRIGFTTLVGNVGQANKLFKELQSFANKETPFRFLDLAPLAQRLIGANVELKKVIPLMRDLGNVTAATGDVSVERLKGINTALTQIISKGRLSAEEMEQLAERGVPAWQILSEATGKTVADLRALSEQGRITSDVMVAALQQISRQKWGDAMKKQSETLTGSLTIIKDIVLQEASNTFEPYYKEISKFSSNIAKRLKEQEPKTRSILVAFNAEAGRLAGETFNESAEKSFSEKSWYEFFGDIFDPAGIVRFFAEAGARDGAAFRKGFEDGYKGIKLEPPRVIDYSGASASPDVVNNAKKLLEESLANSEASAKASFERQLTDLENFYRQRKVAADSGLRQTKAQELAYLRDLQAIEAQNYAGRIAVIKDYWNKRIAAAKDGATREQLTQQGLAQVEQTQVEASEAAKSVANQIQQANLALVQQQRTEVVKALQINQQVWQQAFDQASEKLNALFEKGQITPQSFEETTLANVAAYFNKYRNLIVNEYDLLLKEVGLSDQAIANLNAERNLKLQEITNQQSKIQVQTVEKAKDATAKVTQTYSRHADDLTNILDDAGSAYLEYQDLIRRGAILPVADANLSKAKEAVKLLQDMVLEGKTLEEVQLKAGQAALIAGLQRQKSALQQQSRDAEGNKAAQRLIAQEIEKVDVRIQAQRVKNTVELTKFQIDQAEKVRDSQIKAAEDVANAEKNLIDVRIENDRRRLESAVAGRTKRGGITNLEEVFETARIEREQLLADLDFERERLDVARAGELERVKGVKNEAELKAAINEAFRLKELGLEEEYQQKLLDIAERQRQARIDAQAKDAFNAAPDFAQGVFAGLGVEKFESDADAIGSTLERLGQVGANAFNGLADAMGSVIENWVLYGSAAEGGAQKAVAAALAAASSQSLVSAIMETAYGIAALTPWGAAIYGPAPFHFKSAALFALVAAGTAGVGRAVAGNSFNQGAGAGGGSSNAGQPDYVTSPPVQQQNDNRPITPESVQSNNQGKGVIEMVNQLKTVVQQMAANVDKQSSAIDKHSEVVTAFESHIGSVPEDELFRRGAKKNHGLIADTAVRELRTGGQQNLNDLKRVLA